MTTFNGQYIAAGEELVVPGVASGFTGLRPIDGVRIGIDLDELLEGTFTNTLPIDIRQILMGGSRNVFTHFDDFYYRIYFLPRIVDFGAVANITTQTMKIWNAYLDNVDLDDVTPANNEGIGITLPGILPFTFLALSIFYFDFVASPDGPPDIDAIYTFDFSNGDSFAVNVIGDRARLWNYSVNWAKDFEVSYDFRTEIITSSAKREQRIALRTTPRKELSFEFHATFAGLRFLNNTMTIWNGRPFIVPEFSRFAVMAEPMLTFTDNVDLEDAPAWLVPEMTVLLISGNTQESRQVESVVGNTVTFVTTTETAWPIATKIYPGLASHLRNNMAAPRKTNAVAVGMARFEVIPTSEIVEVPPAAPITFRDREVFLKKHNWRQDVDLTYDHFREAVDYNRGRIQTYFPSPYNSRAAKLSFLNRNKDEAELLREFFFRMKGQRGEFYRPTFENDLIPKLPASIGSAFLRFDGLEIFDTYTGDTVFQAVYVHMDDGTIFYNTIKEISTIDDLLGNDTQIEFDDPWPVAIDLENIVMISWMPVWRLASDTMTLQWRTDSVCDAALTLKLCEHLDAEIMV